MHIPCTNFLSASHRPSPVAVQCTRSGSFPEVGPHRTHRMHIPCTNFLSASYRPSPVALHGTSPGSFPEVGPHRTRRMHIPCTNFLSASHRPSPVAVPCTRSGPFPKLVRTERAGCRFFCTLSYDRLNLWRLCEPFRLCASSGGYLVRIAPDPNHQSDATVWEMIEMPRQCVRIERTGCGIIVHVSSKLPNSGSFI
jgi:hypothetical protein